MGERAGALCTRPTLDGGSCGLCKVLRGSSGAWGV